MPTLWRKDLVCQEAIELLTEYLEGTLSRRQRRRLKTHLDACPNCSAYLEQIRITIRLTGAITNCAMRSMSRALREPAPVLIRMLPPGV